jgi:hypothetical protein
VEGGVKNNRSNALIPFSHSEDQENFKLIIDETIRVKISDFVLPNLMLDVV